METNAQLQREWLAHLLPQPLVLNILPRKQSGQKGPLRTANRTGALHTLLGTPKHVLRLKGPPRARKMKENSLKIQAYPQEPAEQTNKDTAPQTAIMKRRFYTGKHQSGWSRAAQPCKGNER